MFSNWFVPGPPSISARTVMKSNSFQSWRLTVDQPLADDQFVERFLSRPSRLKVSARTGRCEPAQTASAASRDKVRFDVGIATFLLCLTFARTGGTDQCCGGTHSYATKVRRNTR